MKILPAALLLLSPLIQAAPLTQVSLPDGTQVQLNDDHTWEYLVVQPAQPAAQASPAVTKTEPLVLTEQARARPELLAEASREGVSVRLDKASGDDALTLTFVATNQGSRSVVRVDGWISLFDQAGHLWAREPARFWLAETRLPETYLRKGQSRPARDITLTRPAGLVGSPLVRVEIAEVSFR